MPSERPDPPAQALQQMDREREALQVGNGSAAERCGALEEELTAARAQLEATDG